MGASGPVLHEGGSVPALGRQSQATVEANNAPTPGGVIARFWPGYDKSLYCCNPKP